MTKRRFLVQDRRQFLKSASVASASILAASSGSARSIFEPASSGMDPNEIAENKKDFPLGIASGDVRETSALLWALYKGSHHLELWLFDANNPAPDRDIEAIEIDPTPYGVCRVTVDGLTKNGKYNYTFIAKNSHGDILYRSPIGKFKTPPGSDVLLPVKLGVACCTHKIWNPFLYEDAATKNLDAFLLMGDTSYNDGAKNVDEFRLSWHDSLAKKGHIDLRQTTNLIATLDDHEFENNFDPETIPVDQLEAGYQSFYEHMPVRRNEAHPGRIWRKFRWGKTLEIFVLDCRTERRPSTKGTANEQYISREQMDWLKQGLISSDATYKIILNSVPIAEFPFPMQSDRWEGYPSQRNAILGFIEGENIPGVLWVSGDFHFSADISQISSEGPGSKSREILAGPGAQINNYLGSGLTKASPRFRWSKAKNNYMTLALDPHKLEVNAIYRASTEASITANPSKADYAGIATIYQNTFRLH